MTREFDLPVLILQARLDALKAKARDFTNEIAPLIERRSELERDARILQSAIESLREHAPAPEDPEVEYSPADGEQASDPTPPRGTRQHPNANGPLLVVGDTYMCHGKLVRIESFSGDVHANVVDADTGEGRATVRLRNLA